MSSAGDELETAFIHPDHSKRRSQGSSNLEVQHQSLATEKRIIDDVEDVPLLSSRGRVSTKLLMSPTFLFDHAAPPFFLILQGTSRSRGAQRRRGKKTDFKKCLSFCHKIQHYYNIVNILWLLQKSSIILCHNFYYKITESLLFVLQREQARCIIMIVCWHIPSIILDLYNIIIKLLYMYMYIQ